MRYAVFLLSALIPALLTSASVPTETYSYVDAGVVYKNGECVENKWAPHIRYAISGQRDSRYLLTRIQDGLPISIVMNFPIHSSISFIAQMFKKTDCNWSSAAVDREVYESPVDWYQYDQQYSKNMF